MQWKHSTENNRQNRTLCLKYTTTTRSLVNTKENWKDYRIQTQITQHHHQTHTNTNNKGLKSIKQPTKTLVQQKPTKHCQTDETLPNSLTKTTECQHSQQQPIPTMGESTKEKIPHATNRIKDNVQDKRQATQILQWIIMTILQNELVGES
jgi:hypothetical protein